MFEKGQDRHIKGFIINKLFIQGCFSKIGKKHHGRHISVKSLPKGYPKRYRGKFSANSEELKRKGILLIFPSGKKDKHVCLTLNPNNSEKMIFWCNGFRASVELPLLNERQEAILRSK